MSIYAGRPLHDNTKHNMQYNDREKKTKKDENWPFAFLSPAALEGLGATYDDHILGLLECA